MPLCAGECNGGVERSEGGAAVQAKSSRVDGKRTQRKMQVVLAVSISFVLNLQILFLFYMYILLARRRLGLVPILGEHLCWRADHHAQTLHSTK